MKSIYRGVLIYRSVLFAAMAATVAPLSHAGLSQADIVGICKAQAEAQYAQQGSDVRVKLRDIRGNSKVRKVRLQVLPEGGEAFIATCQLNTRTAAIVALEPKNTAPSAVASAKP